MSVAQWIAVAVGAAVGAPLRYVVERALLAACPWGTFAVNVVGSAVLGGLVGAVTAHGDAESAATLVALVGTGFCGSLTTFGGWAAQVLDLAAHGGDRRTTVPWTALGYAAVSILACLAAASSAYLGATAIWG